MSGTSSTVDSHDRTALARTTALAVVTGAIAFVAAQPLLLVVAADAASTMLVRLVRLVRRRRARVRRVVVVGSHDTVASHAAADRPDLVVGAVLSGPVAPRARPRVATAMGDRIGAAALLLVASPVLLLLWAAVRLDSPGSGFHVCTRIGNDGRPFRMFSLRTLREGSGSLVDAVAESSDEPGSDAATFLIRRDPRVTRVGYWLRRWSLDELPRLLNVLRGEMPLGGPPPVRPVG